MRTEVQERARNPEPARPRTVSSQVLVLSPYELWAKTDRQN
jgi:hypothetical protein